MFFMAITYEEAAGRALRLRCPRCGQGKLFRSWFTMYQRCDHCGFVFERAPGFFLGSAYVNYAFMAVTLTSMYMGLHFGLELSNEVLAGPLLAYCVVVPLILFRYARAWWLAMDCYFDSVGAEEDRTARGDAPPPP
jgi:uncharacterized protein (DUF983 family)